MPTVSAALFEARHAGRQIDFVMKGGRVARQDGRMTEPFNYPAAFQ